MSKPGHNSRAKAGPISADRLKAFVERIEKLEEERKAIGGDIKDVYSEAKGVGYDVATMRKIVALRAKDPADRAEQETLLDVYCHALGMVYVSADYGAYPTEEELEARAERIVREVDRCMDLVGDGNKLPTIYAIQDAIGCSAGKASKLRGMVGDRISREKAKVGEMKSTPPDGGSAEVDADETVAVSGRHDAPALEPGESRDTVALERRQSEADEAPAPRSVGAVVREPATERVASSSIDDDNLDIPPFLRGRAA